MSGQTKKRRSMFAKSGVTFPVSRIKRYVKARTRLRQTFGAPVYLASVLEYLCAEIVELAGMAAHQNKKKRITPRHIYIAIAMDEELSQMLRRVIIPQGGVMPYIHPKLLPDRRVKAPAKSSTSTNNTVSTRPEPALPEPTAGTSRERQRQAAFSDISTASSANSTSSTEERIAEEIIPDVRTIWEEKMYLGPKLTLLEGNFLKLSVDAVVNPTDADFSLDSFAGRKLHSVFGEELVQKVKELKVKNGPLKPLDAIIAPTSSSLVKYIIYCFGPTSNEKQPAKKLDELVEKCLNLADGRNLKSIAIPILELSYLPDEQAVHVVLSAITNYFLSVTYTSLVQLYFILHELCNCNSCKNLEGLLKGLHTE